MADLMEAVTSLAKRRGIAFQSSEIYGGLRSSWDYGPLGTEIKRNVREQWWRSTVQLRDDVVGLDASVIMSPKVWEASGHLEVFTDPLVECLNCHQRFRADELPEPAACPNCGQTAFTQPRNFHLMFKTNMGPIEDAENTVYLRPETAQGMFVDFATIQQVSREGPFGIAQIGRSFRNEITPGNFIFRQREFEQMEMGVLRGARDGRGDWHEFWIGERMRWWTDLGLREDHVDPRARRRRAVALLEANGRHRISVPVHRGGARGSRTVPTSTSGRTRRPPARTSPTSTRRRTSGTTRT